MAARFWVPLTVTNVTDNGSGACRITVGAGLATGKVTGETVTVAGVTGATGANVTTTITAISSTTFDLVGTTFGGVYVNGGTVSGGTWNATNIGNWGTSSGTGSGAAVPVAADAVTFDASSGGQTVTVNTTVTVTSITMGAFTGTLDFSVNNNDVTAATFSGSGSGVRSLKMGNGTWTITDITGTPWTMATTTNLTFAANSSVLLMNGTVTLAGSGTKTFAGGALTYNSVTLTCGGTSATLIISGANTFGTLNVSGTGALNLPNATQTAATLSIVGTVSAPIIVYSTAGGNATLSVSGTVTMDRIGLKSIIGSGAASFLATNSINYSSSGITVTPPVSGGIISG